MYRNIRTPKQVRTIHPTLNTGPGRAMFVGCNVRVGIKFAVCWDHYDRAANVSLMFVGIRGKVRLVRSAHKINAGLHRSTHEIHLLGNSSLQSTLITFERLSF
jgi:hypothetical protein